MFKLIGVITLFAVPIVSYLGPEKKFAVEGYSRDSFKQKCKNVSDVDIDLKRNEGLYKGYNECAEEAIDFNQWAIDFRLVSENFGIAARSNSTLTLHQRTHFVAVIQKYCPKVVTFFKCDDILSPIYKECYTADERNSNKLGKDIPLRIFELLCANNAENLIKFTSGNGTECGFEKEWELDACMRPPNPKLDAYQVLFVLTVNNMCNILKMIINCIVPTFEKCTLSPTPGALMRSFFTSVESETVCSASDNSTNTAFTLR